jgi:tetratricopeptide (TPR) repeat protein
VLKGRFLLAEKCAKQTRTWDEYDASRYAFYYARELFFNDSAEQATEEFKRYLNLPTAFWGAERARAYRYLAQCNPNETLDYLNKSLYEDTSRRETYVDIALYYYRLEDWKNVFEFSEKALAIKDKPLDYLCEEFAWNELPYDLAAISAYNLQNFDLARSYGKIALDLQPNDKRLQNNYKHYLES